MEISSPQMKQSDPHRSSFPGKIINNWEQSHWSCTPQTGEIASCHCGTGCIEQEPRCLPRLFPPLGVLSAHSSWIMQSAGLSSAGRPPCSTELYTSFRGNICTRVQRAETVAQRKLESKKRLKTNLAWGHWWYSELSRGN